MKIIRDPIHDVIEIDPVVDKIIDTEIFQRLRRIHQLGFGYLVYPSADHSRFSHSLGVYHTTKRIIQSLSNQDIIIFQNPVGPEQQENDSISKQDVLIASLCHDLAHMPYSHLFEIASRYCGSNFSHEKMLSHMINHFFIKNDTPIISEINAFQNDDTYNFNWDRIINIFKNNDHNNQIINAIISSQFDADRIDYLLRDTYLSGVDFGKFDLEWLLRFISIGQINISHSLYANKEVLFVDCDKAEGTLYDFLLSRFNMYKSVYYHKGTKGLEAIFINIIRRLNDNKENHHLPGVELIQQVMTAEIVNLDQILKFDDIRMQDYLDQWMEVSEDRLLEKLISQLKSHKPYRAFYYSNNEEEQSLIRHYNLNDTSSKYDYLNFNIDIDSYNPRKREIFIKKNDQIGPLSWFAKDIHVNLSNLNERAIYISQDLIQQGDEIRWNNHRQLNQDV